MSEDQVDESVDEPTDEAAPPTLTKADLILDAALQDKEGDKFGHTEIASIVGNLSAYVEMPVNIALFGPWGSGKSSLFSLIEGELKDRHDEDSDNFPFVKAIRYDAWKFSGTPLKRTFITNAAQQLELEKADFRADLYENRSSLQLPFKEIFRSPSRLAWLALKVFGGLVVGSLLLALFWALGSMVPQDEWDGSQFGDFVWDHLRDLGKYALIGFVPILGGFGLLDFAKVTVTRSAPREDEEFQDAFNRLMERAMDRKVGRLNAEWREATNKPAIEQWDRVLIFVDELDRCAPDDVLETLIGIKTFLEHDRCVFVVAADRDVLVEALDKGQGDRTRQATPVRQHEPYYSTAGAFLDKMFQYQLELPTLRRHKLTVFAKDIVESQKEGIWDEFSPTDLDDVIYTLIPLHVRSPRRVKVLLNAFATTARIADARGVTWRDQPAKLAKLTVLRTEFPRFTHDLQLEPRLVKYLEDRKSPGDESTQRLRDLYDNYTLGTELFSPREVDDDEEDEDDQDDARPLSASPLIGSADHDDDALRRTQITINEHLLDYLEKTKYAQISGPTRALLHLESAGQKEGLVDENLADAIDEAPDRNPETTMEAFAEAIAGDRAIAARILGAEIDQQVGPGKESVVETVCRLCEDLNETEIAGVAASVAPAIVRAVGSPLGTSAMIPGALVLGAARGQAVDLSPVLNRFKALVTATTNKSDLRLPAAAEVLPRLSVTDAQTAAGIITEGMGRQDDTGVIRILETASDEAVQQYWDNHGQIVIGTLRTRLEASAAAGGSLEPATVFNSFLNPLLERDEVPWDVAIDLLVRVLAADVEYYGHVYERAESLLPQADHQAKQADLALAALRVAQPEDWPFWLDLLGDTPAESGPVTAALINLIEEVDLSSTADLALLETAGTQLSPKAPGIGAEILENVETRLTSITWNESFRPTYKSFDSLLNHFHPDIKEDHDDFAATEVMRALDQTLDEDDITALTGRITDDLSDEGAQMVLARNREDCSESTYDEESFRALSAAQVRCGDIQPIPVSVFDRLRQGDETLDEVWLSFLPPVHEVVTQYTNGIILNEGAVARYAADLDVGDRTDLWFELEAQNRAPSLLKKVASKGVEPTRVSPIFLDAATLKSDPLRKTQIDRLLNLPLGDDALMKHSTELVEALLGSGVKSNVVLAATVALAARNVLKESKGDIKKAFDKNSAELTKAKLTSLSEIGLATKPKKGFLGTIFGSD